MSLLHLYRHPGLSAAQTAALLRRAQAGPAPSLTGIDTEFCFNIAAARPLTAPEMDVLRWLLAETFEPEGFGAASFLAPDGRILEVGPRMSFTTAWSTNAVAVCHACGLTGIERIERSRRYRLTSSRPLRDEEVTGLGSSTTDDGARIRPLGPRAAPRPRPCQVPVLREVGRRSNGSTGSWPRFHDWT
jgi:phosphoribosylformylglycinamidine synthase